MYPKIRIDFTSIGNVEEARIRYDSSSQQANVSHGSLVTNVGNTNTSIKGFQLSASSLDGSYTYFGADGYPGFLSRTIYTGTTIDVTISFYVYNSVPPYLYIVFDAASGEYAPSFYIENNQNANTINITDNAAVITRIDISTLGVSAGALLTLHVTSWSAQGKSVKVANISDRLPVFEAYGSALIDFRCSENLMDSQLSVTPGICEQYADITIYDAGQILHDRARAGSLETDAQVTLSSIDNGVETILGTYFVADWDINSNSSNVKISCRDKSYLFEKINVPRASVADRTVHELLTTLFGYATNVSWDYLDADTRYRCVNMHIPSSWWLASDLHTMLNKICAVGMLRIYWYIDKFYVGRCV